MKKILMVILAMAFLATLSCASKSTVDTGISPKKRPTGSDKLVARNTKKRPDWLNKEKESDTTNHYFVGLSDKMATEKLARNNAMQDAVSNISQYLETAFRNKIQEISASYGLTSEIIDPTKSSRAFTEYVSRSTIRGVRPVEWHVERWETETDEIYYLAKVLTKLPRNEVERAYKRQMQNEKNRLKRMRDLAKDVKARQQFNDAMNAFNRATVENFIKDK